jgi:hypothetical protein
MMKLGLIITFLILILMFLTTIFFKSEHSSDKKAFEEVISMMSLEKAKQFFAEHPGSRYVDVLVNEIIEWCKQDNTEECYKNVLDIIPDDHPQVGELLNYYDRFKTQKY